VGLETALALSLKLVQNQQLSLEDLILKMAKHPARILGINNDIIPGNPADLTLVDLEEKWVIDPEQFVSKSRNTPFTGMPVQGKAVAVMVDGGFVFKHRHA
jgi:dihydroorotase